MSLILFSPPARTPQKRQKYRPVFIQQNLELLVVGGPYQRLSLPPFIYIHGLGLAFFFIRYTEKKMGPAPGTGTVGFATLHLPEHR